jgi:hypothetical protein
MINAVMWDYSFAPQPIIVTKSIGGKDAPMGVLRNPVADIALFAIQPIKQKIRSLQSLSADWDGNGSAKPIPEAVGQAVAILPDLYRAASLTNHRWISPQVSASEAGEVVLEWWNRNRKLTVYVTASEMSVVRVWGDDIDVEMDEGTLPDISNSFASLWSWIHS